MRRCVLCVLTLSLLLTCACGSATNDSGGTSKDWKRLSLDGVSIAYPLDWELPSFDVPGEVASSPDKRASLMLSSVPGEGAKVSQTDEALLKEQFEASLSYEKASIESFESRQIDGAEAFVAALIATEDEIGREPEDNLIYYALIARGENAVMVTCSCAVKDRSDFEESFKQSIESISVK